MAIWDLIWSSPRDRLANAVKKRLRSQGWTGNIRYDRKRFTLVLGENAHQLMLDNTFSDWRRAPAGAKVQLVDRLAELAFKNEKAVSGDEAQRRLMPALYSRAGFEANWLRGAPGVHSDPYDGAKQPFCDALLVLVALDSPNSFSYVDAGRLTEWGLPFDQALNIAVDNLRACSPCQFERMPGGFHKSAYCDGYDASRILLPHLLSQLELQGAPVAVAMTRDILLVTGSEDYPALHAMAAFVDSAMGTATRPIAYLPITWRRGAWEPLDTGDSRYAKLDLLRVKQSLWDYSEQKKLLDAQHERDGTDIFVATFEIVKDGDQLRSYAVWTAGVDTLLPRADFIALYLGENPGDTLVRSWADFEAACGPIQAAAGYYPPRILVTGQPSREALEQLTEARPPAWLAAAG